MIANKTYNNVIDTLKALGEKHNQIKTTTVGDIFDIDLEKIKLKFLAIRFLINQLGDNYLSNSSNSIR